MTSGAQIRVRFCTLMSLLPSEDVCEEKFTDVEESLISYLSGWVARKAGICREYQQVLTENKTEHSYACRSEDVFARKKRYSSACSVGLVLPCHFMPSDMDNRTAVQN